MDGEVCPTDSLLMMASGVTVKPVEIGIFAPDLRVTQQLSAGEVGYVATGLKTVRECRVGDTITLARARPPLPGYRKSSRWCSWRLPPNR
jgi:GTP-binding protein LepA